MYNYFPAHVVCMWPKQATVHACRQTIKSVIEYNYLNNRFNNGWSVSLTKGLDYFKNPYAVQLFPQ